MAHRLSAWRAVGFPVGNKPPISADDSQIKHKCIYLCGLYNLSFNAQCFLSEYFLHEESYRGVEDPIRAVMPAGPCAKLPLNIWQHSVSLSSTEPTQDGEDPVVLV